MKRIWEDKELGEVILRKYTLSRQYTIRLKRGRIFVSLPVTGSYTYAIRMVEEHRETLLKKIKEMLQVSESAVNEMELKLKAREYLPARLHFLASRHGFEFSSVKISRSKARWGSCSSKKSINLSLYLMLLPDRLIDYVLLHELCHTRHMNHGPEFWLLMDRVCNGMARTFRKELHKYHIPR